MPIFGSEPATTVRQRSPWLLPKRAYLGIFLLVALAAYGWKYVHLPPSLSAAAPQATAKVIIHQPNFAPQPAWQEIIAQAKSEVRDNLSMKTQAAAGRTDVSITLGGQSAESVVPMVNLIAAAYSQACRSQWKLHLEEVYSAACGKTRSAQLAADEAQSRLAALRLRQRQCEQQAEASAKPAPQAQPSTVENPQWTEICRRLTDLEERRRALLVDRTPLHPSVVDIESRIGDIRREMASISPRIVQAAAVPQQVAPQAPASLAGPTAAEMQAAQQAAQRSHSDFQVAQAAERAALTARCEELQVDVQRAEPLPPPPVSPRDDFTLLGAALLAAMTSIIGLGMISRGASLEAALSSVGDLQALLPVPIVGVIPAVHPARSDSGSALRRRLARWSWMTSGVALLMAVTWVFLQV